MIDEHLARIGEPGRAVVMGVINATPDSFSDGGQFADADAAISFGEQLIRDGADLIDVGGESTRPGAARVGTDEELSRIVPIISGLTARGIRCSVDTMRADVAIPLAGEDAARMQKLLDVIEDLDDVQDVYSNFDIAEDLMEQVSA